MLMTTACSCPADPATLKLSPTSCGTSACASFISTIDDRKFNLVKTGLTVCHAKLIIPAMHSYSARERIIAVTH